ncbi:MAG: biotin carboxylase [Deltaproteobacteria bacterium]|nr:biotin carboxylase [Deltaproteobacteria bacterium]
MTHPRPNPLVHADRRLSSRPSAWARSLSCEALKPLIICRGPVRKEAMDVFDEMGVRGYGILLSEKDSITYANALAPELRALTDPSRVHRVPDYTGASKEERRDRVAQMVAICHDHGYNSVFAGYGFMSEDEEMVRAVEEAGLIFIGPCSRTQGAAGLKDQAKRTALRVGVSVTPGVDDATTRALLALAPSEEALRAHAAARGVPAAGLAASFAALRARGEPALADLAAATLAAGYEAGVDLYSFEDLVAALREALREVFTANPAYRVRLKGIAGGGGKGQRILSAPLTLLGEGAALAERVEAALEPVAGLAREILAELKCDGVGDNKNIIAELNIETTRHQEIQVVGNGDWCVTLGGRDCSLQMHEQKLLEVSVTQEELRELVGELSDTLADPAERLRADERARLEAKRATLRADLVTLERMEEEAARFGRAVGLDSVSTFECIVDGDRHYFMEMNTRIQVEHRVTELCYALEFTNPDDPRDRLVVTSLVEVMALLALHKRALPRPARVPRHRAAVEARLNATNDALRPHAGGVITDWSDPVAGEVRDDQGISLRNPDTGVFMQYHLAGAYDSNIALLLTVGGDRRDAYERMREVLRLTKLKGDNLATNLAFHYGLVSWLLGEEPDARPTTRFVVPYLTALGELKAEANQVDLDLAARLIAERAVAACGGDAALERAARRCLDAKSTLVRRPLEALLAEPHLLGGWLSLHRHDFEVGALEGGALEGGAGAPLRVTWRKNPLLALADLYRYLNMERRDGYAAQWQIWDHDDDLLRRALHLYARLEEAGLPASWAAARALLEDPAAPPPTSAAGEALDEGRWRAAQGAHAGFALGMELLSVLPYIAHRAGFFDLKARPDLSVHIPDRLLDRARQGEMERVLAPPPVAKSDEVVAASGGMFYPREAPHLPPFVEVGARFKEGQPLYIVEVMKMFNKVYAPFSGTITEVLVRGDGVIIKKGQPLFKVRPDIEAHGEDPAVVGARRDAYTRDCVRSI